MNKFEWETEGDIPSFIDGKLYLFKIDLTDGFEASEILFSSDLTATELERCHKYRFHKDRIRFSVGRYAVRQLLRPYLSESNKKIEFQFNAYGKPNVDQLCDIKFNISHSGKYLLIGISKQYEVGVDTEVYNATIDHLDLAKSVFSEHELTALEELPLNERIHGFYRCWSMKESFIKAVGIGLQLPLDQFSVDLTSAKSQNHMISIPWNPQLLNVVKTSTVHIDADYSAAYTCHQSIDKIYHFDLTSQLMYSGKKI